MYLTHKFHNLSWIAEINELFHDILIYWDAPVYEHVFTHLTCTKTDSVIVIMDKNSQMQTQYILKT